MGDEHIICAPPPAGGNGAALAVAVDVAAASTAIAAPADARPVPQLFEDPRALLLCARSILLVVASLLEC